MRSISIREKRGKGLVAAIKQFSSESKCRQLFEAYRWPNGRICPHCQNIKSYVLGNGKSYKCANKACRKVFTVTVGTVFENTGIPLKLWASAIYIVTAHKRGISSWQLSRDLEITQKTAWFLLHRIREMLKDREQQLFAGGIYQLDESYIGGKNINRHGNKKKKDIQGRSTEDKTPVFGILETDGRVSLHVVKDATSKTLKGVVNQKIGLGSTIVTDEWPAYDALQNDYVHQIVQHKQKEYLFDQFHTNGIENVWSHLKRTINGTYFHVSPKHLKRYCDETAFRFNTRKNNDHSRFSGSFRGIHCRLRYDELTAPEVEQEELIPYEDPFLGETVMVDKRFLTEIKRRKGSKLEGFKRKGGNASKYEFAHCQEEWDRIQQHLAYLEERANEPENPFFTAEDREINALIKSQELK